MSETYRARPFKREVVPLDEVQRAAHYNAHQSGVETIEVIEHLSGNLCNGVKYVWRHLEKGTPLKDLGKAAWYFRREGERIARSGFMWDTVLWIEPARRVCESEQDSILGKVLAVLRGVTQYTKHEMRLDACAQMAKLCDEEVARLRALRVPCPKCGGQKEIRSIVWDSLPCDECLAQGTIPAVTT